MTKDTAAVVFFTVWPFQSHNLAEQLLKLEDIGVKFIVYTDIGSEINAVILVNSLFLENITFFVS